MWSGIGAMLSWRTRTSRCPLERVWMRMRRAECAQINSAWVNERVCVCVGDGVHFEEEGKEGTREGEGRTKERERERAVGGGWVEMGAGCTAGTSRRACDVLGDEKKGTWADMPLLHIEIAREREGERAQGHRGGRDVRTAEGARPRARLTLLSAPAGCAAPWSTRLRYMPLGDGGWGMGGGGWRKWRRG